jgi:hypothetical protein
MLAWALIRSLNITKHLDHRTNPHKLLIIPIQELRLADIVIEFSFLGLIIESFRESPLPERQQLLNVHLNRILSFHLLVVPCLIKS